MRRGLRAPLALLLTLVVGTSFDFESLLHAHSDWEQDLRAHALARVESARPCDAAPHWDRARVGSDPACAACLAAATALARSVATTEVAPAVPRAIGLRVSADHPRRVAALPLPAGRAPPPPAVAA